MSQRAKSRVRAFRRGLFMNSYKLTDIPLPPKRPLRTGRR